MSPSGVPPDEMGGSRGPDDGFERLLRGEGPGAAEERLLEAFVEDLRTAFPPIPIAAEEAHLGAIAEAARLLADRGDPVARPVSNASGRASRPSWLPKRKGNSVRVPVFRSWSAKIVAGLVVLMSSFGGLAVAGALPGGVQDSVANVASGIGVNLPGGDDEQGDAVGPEPTETKSPEPTETESPEPPETDSPDSTVVGGDQGDQNDQGDQESDSSDQNDQESDSSDQNDQESDSSDQNDQGDQESDSSD